MDSMIGFFAAGWVQTLGFIQQLIGHYYYACFDSLDWFLGMLYLGNLDSFWAFNVWTIWTCNEKFLCMISNGHGMNPKIIAR